MQAINENAWFAPVEEYSDKPFPFPKWVTHCAHRKWEHILQKSFDLSYFAEKFDDMLKKLDRKLVDFGKKLEKKIDSPDPSVPGFLDPEAIAKMKVNMILT